LKIASLQTADIFCFGCVNHKLSFLVTYIVCKVTKKKCNIQKKAPKLLGAFR
jgi:hypothetical protein